jgi:hypothetical protein
LLPIFLFRKVLDKLVENAEKIGETEHVNGPQVVRQPKPVHMRLAHAMHFPKPKQRKKKRKKENKRTRSEEGEGVVLFGLFFIF